MKRILQWVKNLFFFLIACGLSLVIILGAAEGMVFLMLRKDVSLFPRNITGAVYDDFQIRRNIPGARYRHKSYDGEWQFRINSQGFRSGKEYAYQKKPGTLRIMSLGDSFTIGFEVAEDETYSAVLERRLQEKGIDAEVINAGVSGFSNAEALVFYQQEGVKYHPDIVILGFYQNDLMDNVRADIFRMKDGKVFLNRKDYLPAVKQRDWLNSNSAYRWLSEHSYLHNYVNMMATLLVKRSADKENLKLLGFDLEDEDSLKKFETYQMELAHALVQGIYRRVQKDGGIFILMDIATRQLNPSFPRRADMRHVADEYVDTSLLLRSASGVEALNQPHGQHHWTPISHALAAERLAEIIAQKYAGRRRV